MKTTEFDGMKILLLSDDDVECCKHCGKSDFSDVDKADLDMIIRISKQDGRVWPLKQLKEKR